jgi:hypothetical protein
LTKRKDAAVLHWLATALAKARQHDAALATQREAVALRPADKELTEQLRTLEGNKE